MYSYKYTVYVVSYNNITERERIDKLIAAMIIVTQRKYK